MKLFFLSCLLPLFVHADPVSYMSLGFQNVADTNQALDAKVDVDRWNRVGSSQGSTTATFSKTTTHGEDAMTLLTTEPINLPYYKPKLIIYSRALQLYTGDKSRATENTIYHLGPNNRPLDVSYCTEGMKKCATVTTSSCATPGTDISEVVKANLGHLSSHYEMNNAHLTDANKATFQNNDAELAASLCKKFSMTAAGPGAKASGSAGSLNPGKK